MAKNNISLTHIKVEYSTDGERTWKPWTFYPVEKMSWARSQMSRMLTLYPSWEVRIRPAEKSDHVALRKLLRLQAVK